MMTARRLRHPAASRIESSGLNRGRQACDQHCYVGNREVPRENAMMKPTSSATALYAAGLALFVSGGALAQTGAPESRANTPNNAHPEAATQGAGAEDRSEV